MRSGQALRSAVRRSGWLAVSVACAAVAVAAWMGATASASRTGSTQVRALADQPPLPVASVAAAEKTARAIAHGKKIGGSVDFLGVVTGSAGDALLAALKPFETATGVHVNYEATFSQQSILQTRIQAGNPPDVVFSSYPLQLVQLARQGKLVPLNGVVDMQAVERQYPKALLDLGTVKGKLYGYFSIVNYHGLVWYDPKVYTGPRRPNWSQLAAWTKQSAAAGKPPWCLGIESGATTGWPAANEVLDALFVRRYGPKLAAEWESGKLPWTSRQVKWAWNSVGAIFTDPKMVTGGAAAVASTNFLAAGNGMFTNPPTCSLLPEEQWYGEYVPALVKGTTPADVAYFPFPAIAPAYKDIQMVDGNQVAMLRNRAQARALVAYMATPQFETLLAETGQFLVPNAAVAPSAYPTPLARSFATSLVASRTAKKNTILVPSVLFPVPVTNQFFKDLTTYLQNPSQLNALLQDMESVAKSSG